MRIEKGVRGGLEADVNKLCMIKIVRGIWVVFSYLSIRILWAFCFDDEDEDLNDMVSPFLHEKIE